MPDGTGIAAIAATEIFRRMNVPLEIHYYPGARAKSVATWVQREHQWTSETVLPQGNGLVGILASRAEQSSASAQRTTT